MISIRPTYGLRNIFGIAALFCSMLVLVLIQQQSPAKAGDEIAIGVVERPTQTDVELIARIATLGIPKKSERPAGFDLSKFIAGRCGRAASTLLVHPTYQAILINRNPGLRSEDLRSLPQAMALEVPACAVFTEPPQPAPAPRGIGALAASLSMPFDVAVFNSIAKDSILRDELRVQLSQARNGESSDAWKKAMGMCGRPAEATIDVDAVVKFLSCLNVIEIIAANPHVNSLDEAQGEVVIPASIKHKPADENIARIPLGPDTAVAVAVAHREARGVGNRNGRPFASGTRRPAGAEIEASVVALDASSGNSLASTVTRVEEPVEFVTAVEGDDYGEGCSGAANANGSAWPFDVEEFIRVLSLDNSSLKAPAGTDGRILIVDTGFDFTPEEIDRKNNVENKRLVQLAFPSEYFHPTDLKADEAGSGVTDANGDTVPENGGWVGVNLAAEGGKVSAATSVIDPNRGHGLSVATLALGGRRLEQLRRIVKLPLQLGFASIVPLDDDPHLNPGHFTRAIEFATARGNEYNVINFSLSSRQSLSGLVDTLKNRGRGVVVVVAAGNGRKKAVDAGRTAINVGEQLKEDKGVWPAAFGGAPRFNDNDAGVFITVGAHDGKREPAIFSNWGEYVDILAPGCKVPSYGLKITEKTGSESGEILGITPAEVSGTSFAAPTVSFVAGLLMSGSKFRRSPGNVKTRIIVSSDFNTKLKDVTFSSGTLNVSKALGFEFDILETHDQAGRKHVKYGTIGNKRELEPLSCNGETISFLQIKKIAKPTSGSDGRILIFYNSRPGDPTGLKRMFCDPGIMDNVSYEFYDAESGTRKPIKAVDVWDYIARQP